MISIIFSCIIKNMFKLDIKYIPKTYDACNFIK